MIEIVKIGVDVLVSLLDKWWNAGADERAALEKRTLEGIQVMRGEQKIAHEEIAARDTETRRILAEAKKNAEDTKP
ncbi:MAG: hypothetical protein UY96_C0003G0051 [Parcubacteria group bacterium GW2011_GWB1_56_8]|nr:MAG: hypothetical protein UY96_C0003G0051 [Parcubacteria group bacterium GW2011_GWB1_56_8]